MEIGKERFCPKDAKKHSESKRKTKSGYHKIRSRKQRGKIQTSKSRKDRVQSQLYCKEQNDKETDESDQVEVSIFTSRVATATLNSALQMLRHQITEHLPRLKKEQ